LQKLVLKPYFFYFCIPVELNFDILDHVFILLSGDLEMNDLSGLEDQVAELEQRLEGVYEKLDELQAHFDQKMISLEEEREAVAEEAILAGYELGYLQAVVKMTEKKAFLQEASNTFDEIMFAPEMLDVASLEGLVSEIDAFDESLGIDEEDEDWEDDIEWEDDDVEWDDNDEYEDDENNQQDSEEALTESEVFEAVRSWIADVKEEESVPEEELEEV
jgi:hypothetical protein